MKGPHWLDHGWVWLVLYLVCMAALVLGALAFRRWALATYGTPQAIHDWQVWRDEAARQAAGQGPVRRRPPESAVPPAFLLMRDYFPACLGVAIVTSSALFATFMVAVRGVLRRPDGPGP